VPGAEREESDIERDWDDVDEREGGEGRVGSRDEVRHINSNDQLHVTMTMLVVERERESDER